MTHRIHIGPFDNDRHFTANLGATRSVNCATEAAAIMYAFNRWPQLCITPMEQFGRNERDEHYHRILIYVFAHADVDPPTPCAVIENVAQPMQMPDWELWRPYMEKRGDV
jgi:hypothetical protein